MASTTPKKNSIPMAATPPGARTHGLSINDLPAELRLEIYRYYFSGLKADTRGNGGSGISNRDLRPYTAILMTSQSTRSETLPILIREILRRHVLYFESTDFTSISKFLSFIKVAQSYDAKPEFCLQIEGVSGYDMASFIIAVVKMLEEQVRGFRCSPLGARCVAGEMTRRSRCVAETFPCSYSGFDVVYQHDSRGWYSETFEIGGPLMDLDGNKLEWDVPEHYCSRGYKKRHWFQPVA